MIAKTKVIRFDEEVVRRILTVAGNAKKGYLMLNAEAFRMAKDSEPGFELVRAYVVTDPAEASWFGWFWPKEIRFSARAEYTWPLDWEL